jgi:hypothetical protein
VLGRVGLGSFGFCCVFAKQTNSRFLYQNERTKSAVPNIGQSSPLPPPPFPTAHHLIAHGCAVWCVRAGEFIVLLTLTDVKWDDVAIAIILETWGNATPTNLHLPLFHL